MHMIVNDDKSTKTGIVVSFQLIPIIGGPADGQWIVLPNPPAMLGGDVTGMWFQCGISEYLVVCVVETPDEEGPTLTAGEQLWAAVFKDAIDTTTFEEVAGRFYPFQSNKEETLS